MKGVIFDLDGVVVDTAHFHFLAWQRLANKIGIELDDSVNAQLKGVGRMEALDILLTLDHKNYDQEEKNQLARLKNKWYLEYAKELNKRDVLPGILACMEEIKSLGIPIGLASASKNARFILQSLELLDYFDAIVDGLLTRKPKPHPEVFLTCASKINIAPERCLVIEDAVAGIKAAKSAGMMVIGIGDSRELSEADLILGSTSELSSELLTSNF